jgi:hypothetical protein
MAPSPISVRDQAGGAPPARTVRAEIGEGVAWRLRRIRRRVRSAAFIARVYGAAVLPGRQGQQRASVAAADDGGRPEAHARCVRVADRDLSHRPAAVRARTRHSPGPAGPMFVIERRRGRNGERFMATRFRTTSMISNDGNAIAQAVGGPPDRLGVTRVGRVLRRHSLDELPLLFNVLRGDLSLADLRPRRPRVGGPPEGV